jgi:hypothetical protein
MNGSDEVDLRNLYARAQFARRKRNADDDLIFDLVDFFDDDEVEEIKTRRNLGPRPGGSNQKGRPDYGSSPWAQMLRDPTLRVPGSAAGKKFGERFRAPVPVFDKLMVSTVLWHETGSGTDAFGRPRIPTALKLLGVLRVLGRGTCFDGIEELSFISKPTMHSFFHKFCKWFRSEVRDPARTPPPD